MSASDAGQRTGRGELAAALACLVHPLSIAALAVLALNDHLWKGVGPAWLTGKLSDFAGLFYFPFLVAALCALVTDRWRGSAGRVAFAVVAVWFAAAKTIPAAHQATVWLASRLVGDVAVVRDPTDVIALLSLVPAWRLYRRAVREPWPVRRVVQVPIVCAALLLTGATSRSRPQFVSQLIEHEGALYAIVDDREHMDQAPTKQVVFSTGDGMEWNARSALPPEVIDAHRARTRLETPSGTLVTRHRELFALRDGRERLVWGIPRGRHDFMTQRGAVEWSIRDIAPLPGGGVVVAMGSEGVLVGDGVRWHRVAVGLAEPTETQTTWRRGIGDGGTWIFGASAALLAAALFSMLAWLAPVRGAPVAYTRASGIAWVRQRLSRLRASIRLDIPCAIAAVAALGCAGLALASLGPPVEVSAGPPYVSWLLWLWALPSSLGAIALGWVRHCGASRHVDGPRPRAPMWRLFGAGALAAAIACAALVAWHAGWIEALHTTMLITTLGVLLSAILCRSAA